MEAGLYSLHQTKIARDGHENFGLVLFRQRKYYSLIPRKCKILRVCQNYDILNYVWWCRQFFQWVTKNNFQQMHERQDFSSHCLFINLNLTNREMHGNAALLVDRKQDADFESAVDDGVI